MKKIINLAEMTFTTGLFIFHSVSAGANDLKTVSYVDLKKYMGDWHVIANIPNIIEKDCVSSVESYALREDGKIDNWFVCKQPGRKDFKLTALGWVENTKTNAEWR